MKILLIESALRQKMLCIFHTSIKGCRLNKLRWNNFDYLAPIIICSFACQLKIVLLENESLINFGWYQENLESAPRGLIPTPKLFQTNGFLSGNISYLYVWKEHNTFSYTRWFWKTVPQISWWSGLVLSHTVHSSPLYSLPIKNNMPSLLLFFPGWSFYSVS